MGYNILANPEHGGRMKGRISKNLATILRDKAARNDLHSSLVKGGESIVIVGNREYRVVVERADVPTHSPPGRKIAGKK
jgi:hypothetical protein